MAKRRWWPGLGMLTAVLVVLAGGTASAAAGWTVVSVPSTGINVTLYGASARTSTDAWAVGVQFGLAGQPPAPPAAYHWNGSTWSLTPTPALGVNASLSAVSASSASDAWAVGLTRPTGYHGSVALYEHWNGSRWSVVSGPGSGLNAVVNFSSINAVAVGTTGEVEQWNGTAWNTVSVPAPPGDIYLPGNNLTSISASGPNDIWAVGYYESSFTSWAAYALHYNGTSWSVLTLPSPPASLGVTVPVLHGIADLAPNNVWAVGDVEQPVGYSNGTTLIEHWDGTKWSIVPSPATGTFAVLNGVAARASNDVIAAGWDRAANGAAQSLVLRWNGSNWSVDSTPTAGTASPLYSAATLPGVADEWAVGGNSADRALILAHS
jgi:hypothetical protein